jgi:predicted nucleic acid-binding protein
MSAGADPVDPGRDPGGGTAVAIDTSVSIAILVRSHAAHRSARRAVGAQPPVLTAQSLAETYSVLTRLPGGARLEPADAARLIAERFGPPVLPDPAVVERLPTFLAARGIAGGAVYDGLVALAAVGGGLTLLTRDRRAVPTYTALGATIRLVADQG